MRRSMSFVVALIVGMQAAPAQAQGKFGQPAPDFPPGPFHDGLQYSLADCKGKVAVLFFYEAG